MADNAFHRTFPNSWSIRKIGEIAKVKGGKRLPLGSSLVHLPTQHPYLRIVDFKGGRVNRSSLMYVPDDVFPCIARYTISSKDIYISIVGTIGLVGTIDETLDGANLTENAAKICDIDSTVDRDYLLMYLQSRWGQMQIKAQTVGSTQPKLALFRIEDIEVPLPPTAEQRLIGQLLTALDDKIELNRCMNETLEAIAQAVFQEVFAKRGHAAEMLFGETVEISRESINPRESPTEVFEHYSIPAFDEQRLPIKEAGEQIKSNKFIVYGDSVLLSKLNPTIPRVWLPSVNQGNRSVCSTEFLVLRPQEGYSREFVHSLCSSTTLGKHLLRW